MTNQIVRTSLIAFAAFGALSINSQALASQCKGLENAACDSNTACSWVQGYERKDGRQVKSFCRAKPAAKNKVAANAKKTQELVAKQK